MNEGIEGTKHERLSHRLVNISELENAEKEIIRMVQKSAFNHELAVLRQQNPQNIALSPRVHN